MKLNIGQRQVLAEFYGNFALAWITFGLISPVFTGIRTPFEFLFKFLLSLIMTMISLSFALNYKK